MKKFNTLMLAVTDVYPLMVLAASTDELVNAALERTNHSIRYDGAYYPIQYPGGEVPSDIGVCTDVVIRSYRKIGIDLQQLVYQDMNELIGQLIIYS